MNNFENYIIEFSSRSRHHEKLARFILPELKKISSADILEFGVSEKGMSTELFLEYSKINKSKLYSIDTIDYSSKFDDINWNFILGRDDDFKLIEAKIPNKFKLILLDTVHEAEHVKKIIYYYYNFLEKDCCFFIDDISWLPYLKNSDKNRFYNEVNNFETFKSLLEIYFNNRENFYMEFSFQGTGMCKIKKLNNNRLNKPKKIKTRELSFKNLFRLFTKG